MITEINIILGLCFVSLVIFLASTIRDTYLDMKDNEAKVREKLGMNKYD